MYEQRERKRIGERLFSLRREKGLSLDAVARIMGNELEDVTDIESGYECNINALLRYLRAAGVEVRFSHIRSSVLNFVDKNKDRDHPIGEFCLDLLRDIGFSDCTSDGKRLAYIRRLNYGNSDSPVRDTIQTFLDEYDQSMIELGK